MQPNPEPTPAPAPSPAGTPEGPPAGGDALIEFIRADRQRAAFVFLGLSALLLALCGWSAVTGYNAPNPAGDDKNTADKADDPFKGPEDEGPKPRKVNRNEYLIGAVLAAAACLVGLGAGGWLLVSLPPPELARQRTDARAVLLAVGGLLGALLILSGVVYFYLWSEALFDWLDRSQTKQAKYVLGPLLAVAGGAALMFLAVQPARAEERNNRLLRQLIYGTNMGLSVLLLFVALVVVNLVVSPQLPNKLDVTETGFYSLSPGSIEFLQRLPEPVTAYAILPDTSRRQYADIRRLLDNAQSHSGGKFTAKYINPTAEVSEYTKLKGKYPLVDANEYGVFLTVGEDDTDSKRQLRHSFIRDDEFTQTDRGDPRNPQPPSASFVGESRLLRELLFLSEGDKKAVVYLTQSAGELDISDGTGGDAPTDRILKEYLTRNYLDVRPLKLEGAAPKVPDDAAVVVVVEPRFTMPAPQVTALRQYMTEPRAGKKGKLILLAGAEFGTKGEVLPTGLEALMLEFNVRLDNRFILSDPSPQLPANVTAALFTPSARKAKNPIAISLAEKTLFPGSMWRQVAPASDSSAFQAVALLGTMPGRRSWLEDQFPPGGNISQIVADVITDPDVARKKQFASGMRPVGVAVSEGGAGRVVVVGNGYLVEDQALQTRGADALDLVGSSVDWLRDRPPLNIDIQSKKYKEFKFPMTADENRVLWVPLLLAMVLITGLGVSVWVVRRQP